jgi:Plexin repeat
MDLRSLSLVAAAAVVTACVPPSDPADPGGSSGVSEPTGTSGPTTSGPTTSVTTSTSESATSGPADSSSSGATEGTSDASATDASAGTETSEGTTVGASTGGASETDAEASSSGGPPPDCAASTDCESCGEVDGCGWCGATGMCSAGDAVGPAVGECSAGWEADGDFFSCPAVNCFAQTNCGDCQDSFIGCGWCASNNTCMPGAPDVPAPGGECEDQQWYFDICPEDCADEMTCVSCTATVGCGWCFGSGSCTAGTDVGPLAGACNGEWSTEVGACF